MTMTSTELKSALEAIIYAADEPATLDQLASILGEEKHVVRAALDELVASYASDERGVEIRAVAGGYRVYTKPQIHQEPAAAAAADHAGSGNPGGDRLQAAGDAAGNAGNSRRELRRGDRNAAGKTPDHHGGAQTSDRPADSLSHLERFSDAIRARRSRRIAEPEGVRGAGARSAGRRRRHRRRGAPRRDGRGEQRASGAGISITFDAGCGRCERSFRRIARFEGRRGARFCIRIEARIERRCHARFGIARRGPSCRRGNSRRVRRPRGETGRARQFAVIFGQSARRLARVVILSGAAARLAFVPFSVRAARSEESLSSPGGSPGGPERFFVVPQNARDSSE